MVDHQSLRMALAAGGLMPGDIEAGHLIRCPVEGDHGGKRSGAYRVFDDAWPTCPWWNWRAGTSGVWVSADRPATNDERVRQREKVEQARRERAADQAEVWSRNHARLVCQWDSARSIRPGCPVAQYLENRGLAVPATDVLRCIPRLDYWQDGDLVGAFPAMVAAVTSPDGDLVAIHRTYLTDDGHKAPVPTVKKLTGTAGPMACASIKIGAPAPRPDGGLGLGVAEGIETAIAAAILSGVPTWSCVSAHGIASFTPPNGLRSLYVFGDHDQNMVGQRAAAVLAKRTAASGLVVRVLIPEAVGDWNDELVSREATV